RQTNETSARFQRDQREHRKRRGKRSSRALLQGTVPPAIRLTVKLRGRPEAPDWSRGCTLSSRTRGDNTDLHGPLQRLLEVSPMVSRIAVQQATDHLLVRNLRARRVTLKEVHASLAQGNGDLDTVVAQNQLIRGRQKILNHLDSSQRLISVLSIPLHKSAFLGANSRRL